MGKHKLFMKMELSLSIYIINLEEFIKMGKWKQASLISKMGINIGDNSRVKYLLVRVH
jgi:hypothetical protein